MTAIESCAPPPVPQVLLRLLSLVTDEGVSTESLADLIGQDPVIAARVLAAANSAAYRRSREMVRLKDCVQLLGLRLIRTIATCIAVQQTFDPLASRAHANLSGFWHHSLCVAEATRALATATSLASSDEAYLAGLLHDLGELLLLDGLPEYAGLLSTCVDEAQLPGLELAQLDCDHAAVGSWLIQHWQLGMRLSEAVLFHHSSPQDIADADDLSRLLWVAHHWAASGKLADSAEYLLGTDATQLVNRLASVRERVDQMASAIGIETSSDGISAMPLVSMATQAPLIHSQVSASLNRLALLQPLQSDLLEIATLEELVASLGEAARILFGLEKFSFLLLDPTGQHLHCKSGKTQSSHAFTLPVKSATHLASMALENNQPAVSWTFWESTATSSRSATLSDIRLMRLLNAENLLCLPLQTRLKPVGVLAVGCTEVQRGRILRQLHGMTEFAQLSTLTIIAWQQQQGRFETERRNTDERHMRQGRRLVHEAGNPLGIIKNYLSLLKRKIPDIDNVQEELAVINEELSRVSRILERFGQADEAGASASIDEVVRDMLSLYEPALITPRQLTLETRLSAPGAITACSSDSLRQILLNLLKNAAAALPERGKIMVSTSADHYLREHRCAELCIADDGPGLPSAVREKLLHPELQPPAANRGLGLGIVRQLVTACSGEIIVSSRPGGGTAFSILLPMQPTNEQEEAR